MCEVTSGRFKFELATSADDSPLRDLLTATPMLGEVSITLARQPSYFSAAVVDGSTVQVGVARDRESSRIIGMGSRALTERYVNGEPVVIGYLGGLRLLQEFRGQAGLLARGYRFLRKLHEDRRAPFYLTTIAADNNMAIRLLTSARAGLPVYHPCGNYHTVAISAARRLASINPKEKHPGQWHVVDIRPATAMDRNEILRFLHEHGPSRQFFPVYQDCDLFAADGLLKGLQPADVWLAYRNGEIVGTLACWDQRPFKQIIIHSYRGWIRSLRPVYNVWAAWRRKPTLPVAGSVLPVGLAAIPVVRDNDPQVFQQLLETVLHRMAEQGQRLLLIGLHEADPLLPIVRQYSGREYVTKIYIVYWPNEPPDMSGLMQLVPYLELGCL